MGQTRRPHIFLRRGGNNRSTVKREYMATTTTVPTSGQGEGGKTRRDFLIITSIVTSAVGAGIAMWPFVDSMNPAADTLALSTTDLDVGPIAVGQRITVVWQGKPVFVSHRTAEEIDLAKKVDVNSLRDPATDAQRAVIKPEWLIVVGICTHLGCVPGGQKPTEDRGEFAGWRCPCHGSQYDTAARIRKGPAPKNLPVPAYKFTGPTAVTIG